MLGRFLGVQTKLSLCSPLIRYFSRRSVGIVGMPNIGKSTLFNALTETQKAEAKNFPFCTIEPNVGIVSVPDPRLDQLALTAKSKRCIRTQIEFIDIAGLIKGASEGKAQQGLGNKFLANIRSVSCIIQVIRCFDDPDICHVDGTCDPIRDIETIESELLLADLEVINRKKLKKKNFSQDEQMFMDTLNKLENALVEGTPIHGLDLTLKEKDLIKQLGFLTTKKSIYVCNIGEDDLPDGNKNFELVQQFAKSRNMIALPVCAKLESEASMLDEETRSTILDTYGLKETGLQKIIKSSYDLLNLITFYTVGPEETRAWNVKKDSLVPQAAGEIHTDMENGFIKADTVNYADLLSFNCDEDAARKAKKLRPEGPKYVVQDGDVFHFKFKAK
ncbi:hypothetical protein AKO1_009836 [Acrasis kona]|uniref:Obg-like ATPase 1 n=1 Tax=Acrasis kona TaxID=1008807 RepID=A0AAW2ZNA0_9EUKA